jgi:hypothetical protein
VFGGNTCGNSTVITPVPADKAACEAKCTEARDYCHWYTWDGTVGSESCTLYSGVCAAGTAVALANTYEKKQMCYWTDPLLIHTALDCANGAELNGGTTIDQFPITVADLKRPHQGLDLFTCHQMCQEDATC